MLHLTHSIDTVIFGVDFTDVFYHSGIAQTARAKPAGLGLAIVTGCDKTARTVGVNVLHMNLIGKRSRCLSMNWIISDVLGRVPMRKKPMQP